jgi:hypothetical protein
MRSLIMGLFGFKLGPFREVPPPWMPKLILPTLKIEQMDHAAAQAKKPKDNK